MFKLRISKVCKLAKLFDKLLATKIVHNFEID